jgi:hypothetical protein
MKERKAAAMQLVSDVVQATPELQGMPKNKYNQAGNQIAQRVAGGEAVDPVDVVRTVLGVERVAPAAPVAAPTVPVAAPTPQFDITPIQVAPTRAERVAAAKPIINDIIDANYGDVMVPGKVTNQIATQMAQRAARKEVFNPTNIVQSVLAEKGLIPEVAAPEMAAPEMAAPEMAVPAPAPAPEMAAPTPAPTLYHGGRRGMTPDDISIIREPGATKQGKKGKVYGGFYTTANPEEAADYAAMAQGDNTVYQVQLKPDAVVEQKEGDITRLTPQQINDYVSRGVDVVVGNDVRGRTEHVIVNRDAVLDMQDTSAPAPTITQPKPAPTPQQVVENIGAFAQSEAEDRGFDPGMFREGVRDIAQGRELLTDQQILDAQGPEYLDAYKAGIQWAQDRFADLQAAPTGEDEDLSPAFESIRGETPATPAQKTVIVVHGGSDFENIDPKYFGTGEPGNIRPLGNGLYGYVVDSTNTDEIAKAVDYARHYAKKYGRGKKAIHAFQLDLTGADTGFNGPIIENLRGESGPERQRLDAAYARRDTFPSGSSEWWSATDEVRDAERALQKSQAARFERLPAGLIEVGVTDTGRLKRIGKIGIEQSDSELVKTIQDALGVAPAPTKGARAPGRVKARGATQKANGKAIKATITRKPGKTAAEKILNMAQTEIDQTPKEDIAQQATPYDSEYETIRAKPGINATRMAKMLGPQLYGDPTNMGQVCIKEVLQNSFDATRTAVNDGQVALGKIDIVVSDDGRTLTVKDNGIGMTPELLGGKFLEIAGTAKEGDKNAGGFGIAKMLFLYANKNIRVSTARDGRVAVLDVTGEQLFEALDNPDAAPDIEVRDLEGADQLSFPDGHGTIIQLTIPETAGDYQIEELPHWLDNISSLELSPLFANIAVTFQGRSRYNPDIVKTGANFPVQDYTQFVGAKFPWGTAKVYITREQTGQQYGDNMHILSNGLWQFSTRVNKDPSNIYSDVVPYRFYVDIVPSVKPDQPGYPFNFNRQNFTDDAKADFGKIKKYIDAIYAYKSRAGEATSFGNVQYFDENGMLGPVIDLTPDIPVQDTAFTRIGEGDQITLSADGSLLVNGQVMPELTPDQLKAGIPSANDLRVNPDLIDTNSVMVHDNADVVIKSTGDKMSIPDFMRSKFGARFDDFMRFNGDTFLKLRNEVARVMGYKDLYNEAIGVSFDPEYRGVSIRLPFSGSFINPLVPKYGDPLRAGYGIFGTMIHELAHHKVRSHNANFPAEMQDIMLNMESDVGFTYQRFKDNFADTIAADYADIVQLGVELFNGKNPDISVEYRGNRFKDGSGEQAPEGTGARGASDVRGPSGERGTGESVLGPAYERSGGTGERGKPAGSNATDAELIAATKLTKAQINFALQAAGLKRQKADNFQNKIAKSRNATEMGTTMSSLTRDARSQKDGIKTLKALTDSLSDKSLNLLLPTLSTDDITRWVGDRIKAIPRINKLIEDITVYRMNRIRQLADDADVWTKFNAEFEEGGIALGDVMHAATFYDVDPSLAPTAAEYMRRDAELQGMFKKGARPAEITRRKNEIRRVYEGAVTDNGQVIYGYNDLAKAELGGGKAKAIYRMARDAYRNTFNEHYNLLMKRIDNAGLEEDDVERAKEFIEKLFADARKKVVYFPLMRHGRYWLSVGKGKNSEFYLFESATARNKFRLVRQEELDQEGRDADMEEGDDIRELRANIANKDASVALKNIFQTLEGGSMMNMDLLKDHIFQMYLQALPESDMRKRFTRRQYKTGFSTDTLRNFIVSQHTAANQLARLAHANTLLSTISAGYSELKGNPNAPRLRKFLSEVELRAKAEIEPEKALEFAGIDFDKLLSMGNKMAFIWLLTSPKSALIQMTQLHVVGLPVLSAEFGEKDTYATAMRYGINFILGKQLSTTKRNKAGDVVTDWGEPSIRDSKYIRSLKDSDPELYKAMVFGWNYANDRDMFMSTYAADMTERGAVPSGEYGAVNAARRGQYGSAAWQGTKAAIGFMSGAFHHMERINRETMYMSTFELAYKRAIKQGSKPKVAQRIAAERAAKLTYEAMFNFSNYNKPRIAKFRATKLGTQFMTYSASMTSYLVRNFYGMLKSVPSKGGRKAAARKFFGTMGMTFMYAGITGLPLFSLFMALMDGLRSVLGDDDDDILRYADEDGNPVGLFSTEYWFRTKGIPEMFGTDSSLAKALGISDEAAEVLARAAEKGPISAATGLDIGSSTSLNDLWFSSDVTSEGETALYERAGRLLLGPAGGVLGKFAKSVELFEKGYGDRAFETLLPAFFAGGAKASRFAEEGVRTLDGKEIKPADFFDFGKLFAQTAGFTNTEVSQLQKQNFMASEIERTITDRKSALVSRFNVLQDKDARNSTPATRAALDAVYKDIDRFNDNFPYIQITPKTLGEATQRRTEEAAQSSSGATLNPRIPVAANLFEDRE